MTGPARGRRTTVRLPDGARVTLRPLGPEDRQVLAEGFARLSETSRYLRFFTVMRELDAAMLTYLTEIDHHDHEAIIALDRETGDGIGIARYVRAEPGGEEADFAVAVIDDWHGRGVGRALLRRLAARARQEGVRIVTAAVKVENPAALELLSGLGGTETVREGSEFYLRITLPKRGLGARLSRALHAVAVGSLVPARPDDAVSAEPRA